MEARMDAYQRRSYKIFKPRLKASAQAVSKRVHRAQPLGRAPPGRKPRQAARPGLRAGWLSRRRGTIVPDVTPDLSKLASEGLSFQSGCVNNTVGGPGHMNGGDPSLGNWDPAQKGSFDEYIDRIAVR